MGRIRGFPECIALLSAPQTALFVFRFSLVDLRRDFFFNQPVNSVSLHTIIVVTDVHC